ncbi:hypothetical protein [Microbacterium terricola]|uniref:Uncharacterized protein n=1 Tax=Microbacterium terricola TaxID=344163 RepID=A0ABM8E112_9MICO|nr:hypothetical protein [Microbacterium terricola]UYK40821.1 hypothetical protein OAU46_04005 [Microbacterium terricola]BDV31431.1 hypothetical protein Microterr_20910 [Microbacterium terricola]
MNNDYSGLAAGLGVGFFVLMLVLYFAILGLMLWVSYLILRTAVKNGILLADQERAKRGPIGAAPRFVQQPPPPPPYT